MIGSNLPATGDSDQIWKTFAIFSKMISMVQDIESKMEVNREALGTIAQCFFNRAGQNGGKFHTVSEEEIAGLLP